MGFFREVVGVPDRDGDRPSPFYRGSAGAPPVRILARPPDLDYPILCEVQRGTSNFFAARQIVLRLPSGGTEPVLVTERMAGPDELRAELRRRNLAEGVPICVVGSEEERAWLESLLSCFPAMGKLVWETTRWTAKRCLAEVHVEVTSDHFRAVAKIAFHYALSVFRDLSGGEPEFSPLRRFILDGGRPEPLVCQRPGHFLGNFAQGERPTKWCHILSVERSRGWIVARCYFFAGPEYILPYYETRVGRVPRSASPILRLPERRAHLFVYDVGNSGPGHDGRVVEPGLSRLVEPVVARRDSDRLLIARRVPILPIVMFP
jgi:hypothetical protein